MTPKEREKIRDAKLDTLINKLDLVLALAIAKPGEKKGLIDAIKSGEILDD